MNTHQIEFKALWLTKGIDSIHNSGLSKHEYKGKKMKYNAFIGIDISKLTIDAAIRSRASKELEHQQFENSPKGYARMLTWAKRLSRCSVTELFFCVEHTGVYALPLACFLTGKGLDYRLENPYHLKHSMGLQRGKNDRVDAQMIARYAYLHHEELRLTTLPPEALITLQNLLAHRERLVKTKRVYTVAPKELASFTRKESHAFIGRESQLIVSTIERGIKAVEGQIESLIQEHADLDKNFRLARSVTGVGLVIAAYMLVYTHNFTAITDPRCFASYSGIAPFGRSSGSSLAKAPRVSHLANKRMKALLSNGARSAIRNDPEIRAYFQRKCDEGKPEMLVANAVKNKLVGRIFATVKRGTPFVGLGKHFG